jgi:hypothetical protein
VELTVLEFVPPVDGEERRVELLELEVAFDVLEESLDLEIQAAILDDEGVTDVCIDVEDNEEDFEIVESLTELVDVFGRVEKLDTDPMLLLLDPVPCEVVPFRIYTLSLLPAPQYLSAENGDVSFTSSLGTFQERSNNSGAAKHISGVETS